MTETTQAPGQGTPGLSHPSSAKAFEVERHGLDPIPRAERHGTPRKLLWVWVGGAYNYVTLAAGALPILFGVASAILVTGVLFFVLPHIDWQAKGAGPLAGSTEAGTFFLALGAMFAGPLSWSNYAADYARYLPEDTDTGLVALFSGLGMGIANVTGCAIGIVGPGDSPTGRTHGTPARK